MTKEPESIVEFDKCPDCGSTSRVVGDIVRREKEAGRLSEDVEFGLIQIAAPMLDPRKITLVGGKVPVIVGYLDMCRECGRIYGVKVQEIELPITMTAPPGGMPGGMPGGKQFLQGPFGGIPPKQ